MPAPDSRLLIVGVCAALVAGCGGGASTSGSGSGPPTTVTVSFQPASPVAVATQTGSGAFTMATVVSNTVTLSVPAGTTDFAVAYLCPSYTLSGTTFQRQFVFEASVGDGTAFDQICANPAGLQLQTQNGTLSGTVDASAIPNANMVWLFGGSGGGTGIGGSVEEVNAQLPLGTDDVVALASQNELSGNSFGITILAIKDLGEQAVPGTVGSGNPIVLGTADETTPQPITYRNVPSGGAPGTSVTFRTQEGGLIPLQSSTTSSYPAVPAAMLNGSTQYSALSIAGDLETSSVSFNRAWNGGGGPLTVVFPSPWSYSGPSAAALPAFDFSTYSGFTGTAGVTRVGTENWQPEAGLVNSYQLTASGSFEGAAGALALPNLSALSGFLADPASGTTVSWQASISQNSAGAIGATPLNSSTQTAQNAGQFVVP